MSPVRTILVAWSLALGCVCCGTAHGEPAEFVSRESGSVSASTAGLESEIAELAARLNAIEQVGVPDRKAELRAASCPAWLVSVDFLYWEPRQRGTDFAITTDDSALSVGRGSVLSLEMDHSPGVRANLGYRTCSGWELGVIYTHFGAGGTTSAAVPDCGNMWATRSHPSRNEEAATAEASGHINYNVFDLEARYPLVDACSIGVQIFGGLRWAQIDEAFQVDYDGVDFDRAQYRDDWRMNGFGVRLGGETQWRWNASWSLFGNAAGSVLGGRFRTHLLETDAQGADTIVDVQDDYDQGMAVLEAAAGIAWTHGPLQMRAGYELHNWFNLADRSMFPDAEHEGLFTPLSNDVLLDGLFVRLGYTY